MVNPELQQTTGGTEVALARQLIRRLGQPEEVAALMVFLASDATFSTGSEFMIDGGQLACLAHQPE
jgi:3alpha(or 20beta)-hydroxysteroid dehydrogenase